MEWVKCYGKGKDTLRWIWDIGIRVENEIEILFIEGGFINRRRLLREQKNKVLEEIIISHFTCPSYGVTFLTTRSRRIYMTMRTMKWLTHRLTSSHPLLSLSPFLAPVILYTLYCDLLFECFDETKSFVFLPPFSCFQLSAYSSLFLPFVIHNSFILVASVSLSFLSSILAFCSRLIWTDI